MRTILTTVGTSLLSNAKKKLGLAKEATPTDQQLAIYLRHTDRVEASAETNSLSRLLREGDRIVFLCSQTDEGQQCAAALARHYRNAGYNVPEPVQVRDLTYKESHFKMRGLCSLVAALIGHIHQEQKAGREVLINATGGFKAEIAYATLVGLLFRVPVHYIHEAFQDVIDFPPVPIGWDYSLLADYEEFFEWLESDLRPTPEVDARLRELSPEVRMLLEEEEGFTFLSPAGEAFYEAFLTRLEEATTPIWLSRTACSTYDQAAPNLRNLFDRALRKLRLPELRATHADQVRNCDCRVFPKGRRDERVFFYDADDGSVRVCELARHGDGSYSRLIEHGVQRENYSGFTEWRPMG